MRSHLVSLCVLGGCALHADVPAEPSLPAARAAIVGRSCGDPPRPAAGAFRRARNRMVARLGSPRHRGVDLIAVETDQNQTVAGKLAYTALDKDLRGERVELSACIAGRWANLGSAVSGADGRFALELTGDRRLPPGLHALHGFVPGDASTIRFLAFVARVGERVIVTDIDGTITESENAILNTVLFGDDIAHRLGAPEALAGSGLTVVYVTARGDQYTDVTRRWLAAHGFPVGPMRLASATLVRPGAPTIAFKTATLRALTPPIAAAIGNKHTDVVAYASAGLRPDQIFVKLPEFEGELAPALRARRAIGFREYRALVPILSTVTP